ncbi:hypothetical protein [Halarcobacter ebronensis]|uniref:Uncharacterized protein n=1 Tax=Halarcobacter ebronensis TaxID=1462615 RepID=A0A4Q1AZG4_9BACT|nr:hypothetical protein [Halarcobacter ebronensis]QKF82389.1 putative membrane protein [Halarcobacter ebronensis]RXK07588.1 hypothetical protein CRV07_03755 [Halarcobacter ebronensis]
MSGLIIIPIYMIYVVIGFILFKWVLKLFKKRLNSIIVLVIVIFFPFWDIFAANGILKVLSYTTKPIIYEMPEKDKDGKIESIGVSLTRGYIDLDDYNMEFYKKTYADKVRDYVEYTARTKNPLYKDKKNLIAKVYLDPNSKKDYEIIEKSEARYIYKLVDSEDDTLLGFKIFKSQAEFIDTKKNKTIAVAPSIRVGTPYIMNLFRGGILMLISGGGGAPMFGTKPIITFEDCKNQLFDIKGL